MRERNYWTDPLTWSCNLGIFVFGIVLAVLGAILPSLFLSIQLNPAQAGSLFLFLNLGALMVTLAGGPSFDRFGYRRILILSSLLATAGAVILGLAGHYEALCVGSFVLGLGGGGLNLGTNALVSELYPSREGVALNRLGVFFGLGTLFIPLCIGLLLNAFGLKTILLLAGAVALLPAMMYFFLPFPSAKHAAGFPFREAASLLRSPFVLLLGILLFFQSGNEMTTGGWLTTFLVERRSLSPATASFFLSAFWGALVIGRFTAGLVLGRVSPPRLVQVGALGSAFSILLLLVSPNSWLAALAVSSVGFFMAFIFPTVMGQASNRYPALAGTVLGLLMGIALTGGMLAPWLTGIMVDTYGTSTALLLPVVGFGFVFLLQTLAARR
jgi:MFS transporter, FHS family, glucose/mannose:H+ symporter